MKKEKEKKLNTRQVVELLDKLLKEERYKKKEPLPKFDKKEINFLIRLIFKKPQDPVFLELADLCLQKHDNSFPFTGRWLKKSRFLYYLVQTFNAAKAARLAGYSPNCARQQGWRLIKEIQGYKRKTIRGLDNKKREILVKEE